MSGMEQSEAERNGGDGGGSGCGKVKQDQTPLLFE